MRAATAVFLPSLMYQCLMYVRCDVVAVSFVRQSSLSHNRFSGD